MEFIKLKHLQWEYEIGGERFPLKVTEELEHWLKRYYKIKDIESLGGVDITRVFAELLSTSRPGPVVVYSSTLTAIKHIVGQLLKG